MSGVLRTARALMAVLQPRTGGRATGPVNVVATGGDVVLPRNRYALPVVDGQQRPDLAFKVGEGPGECGSWVVTSSGTQVDMLSNIGGRRHNLPAGTKLAFDPPISGIRSAEAGAGFSGGTDLAEFGALRDVVFYEHLDGPIDQVDLRRSLLKGFPAAVIAWQDDEPADGATVSQTIRETRTGTGKSLYKLTFQIAVFSERSESDHVRRAEGLEALDRITTLVADRQSVDGEPFSNPSGVQVRRRWRETGRQPVYKRFYVYGLLLGVETTLKADDSRTYNEWLTTVVDADVQQRPAQPNQGDFRLVEDLTIDMRP